MDRLTKTIENEDGSQTVCCVLKGTDKCVGGGKCTQCNYLSAMVMKLYRLENIIDEYEKDKKD